MTPADTKEAWRRAMTDLALCKSRRRIAQSREAIRQCETAIEIAKLNVRVAAREHMHAVLDEGIKRVLEEE